MREALETALLVAAEAGVHAGINGPMHSGQNSVDALDLIEHIARTALAVPRPDRLSEEERLIVEAERRDRCHCHESYTGRDLIDPECSHEAIDELLAVLDAHFPAPVNRPESEDPS